MSEPRPLPGPRGLDLLRSLAAMRRDPLGMLARTVAEFGDAVALPMGREALVLLNHPSHLQHVLQANAKNYKKSVSYRELSLVLGQGLLTSEGAFWKRQRRIAQPSFARKRIAKFSLLINRETNALLERWREAGQLEVDGEMTRLTLAIIGQALFGVDLSLDADRLGQSLGVCLPFVQRRTEALFNWPMALPLPSHLRFRREVSRLDDLVADLVAERREGGQADDLLSALVFARDPETGEAMNARQIRDEIVTFLLAGHETTAHALAWTLYLLAGHPDVTAAVRAEEDRVLGGREPAPDDVAKLDLTKRVILESLRLYPPAWMIEREALADDVVGGWHVPKGSLVMLCTQTVHRHRDVWSDPDRFDPDRFLRDQAKRPRCAFLPFGAGQRQCIGEGLAMLEMQQIVPRVVRAFDLEPVPSHVPVPEPGITLRPRDGIRLRPSARATCP